jgi:hypothetical protein
LSVQEPVRDLVLTWVLHDSDNTFQFIVGQFSCSTSMHQTSCLNQYRPSSRPS